MLHIRQGSGQSRCRYFRLFRVFRLGAVAAIASFDINRKVRNSVPPLVTQQAERHAVHAFGYLLSKGVCGRVALRLRRRFFANRAIGGGDGETFAPTETPDSTPVCATTLFEFVGCHHVRRRSNVHRQFITINTSAAVNLDCDGNHCAIVHDAD